MADKEKPEATEKKARKPRKARTFVLIRSTADGTMAVIAHDKTLKALRGYKPPEGDGECTYREAVLLGEAFTLRPVQNIVREVVK